jgi:ABC-type Fe3+-hydroxamate transport system substrate-binding protein
MSGWPVRHGGNRLGGVIFGVTLAACSAVRTPAADSRREIVSLHDVTTEVLLALGIDHERLAVAGPVDLADPTRQALTDVSRVGGLESILACRPRLVVGTQVVEDRDPELVAALRQRNIAVQLYHQRTVDDLYDLTLRLAGAIGGEAPGRALVLVAGLEARVAAVRTAPAAEQVRVFVYDCCDPPFTAGAGAPLSDLLAKVGAVNVFADVDADWAHVSWEAAVARRPQLILINDYALAGQSDRTGKRLALEAISGLAGIPTVAIPLRYSLGGLSSIDGLEALSRILGEYGGRRG